MMIIGKRKTMYDIRKFMQAWQTTAEEFLEDGAHADVGEGGYLQAVGALHIFIGEEEDFIDALESADGVISGVMGEPDEQALVYCRANHIEEDIPVYWCEEEYILKSIDMMGWYDAVPSKLSLTSNGETKEVKCDFLCESVYLLYRNLKENNLLYKTPTISSAYIKREEPDFYNEILEELTSNGTLSEDQEDVAFTIENTLDFFDSILG